MAVKKITPKNPEAKASAAKGDKKGSERKTASSRAAHRKTAVVRTTHSSRAH